MNKTIMYGLCIGIGILIGGGVSFLIKPHHFNHTNFNKLSLSEVEREQIKDLFKEDKGEVKPLVEEMNRVSEELKAKLQDSGSSEEELRKSYQEFQKLKQQLTDRRFEINLKIRKVLGPEKMKNFDVLGPLPGPRHHREGKPEFHRRDRKSE